MADRDTLSRTAMRTLLVILAGGGLILAVWGVAVAPACAHKLGKRTADDARDHGRDGQAGAQRRGR